MLICMFLSANYHWSWSKPKRLMDAKFTSSLGIPEGLIVRDGSLFAVFFMNFYIELQSVSLESNGRHSDVAMEDFRWRHLIIISRSIWRDNQFLNVYKSHWSLQIPTSAVPSSAFCHQFRWNNGWNNLKNFTRTRNMLSKSPEIRNTTLDRLMSLTPAWQQQPLRVAEGPHRPQ